MNAFNFEFVIPLKRDDLLASQTENQFYVSEVYRSNELKGKIEECKVSLKESGCDFILEHFGTLFSVIENFEDFDFKFLQSFYNDVIIEGLNLVNNTLCMLFEDDDIYPEVRNKMLNVTKMTIYIAAEFLKSFQEKLDKTYNLVIDKRGKKNTKLLKLKEDHDWDWEVNERLTLNLINKIIKLHLHLLWDPPMPEKEFVRMVEDCCYAVLEKPNVTSVKMKPTRDVIFEILAVLITQYNNAISCKVKIVQMLKLYEHVVSILAQAVIFFVKKYNCRSLIKELIIEIIETGGEMDNFSDSSSSKAFSNFIVEIAMQQPELILPCVNLLIHNLSCDPYSMRICVLTVMSEIVMNVLHSDKDSSDSVEEGDVSWERKKTRHSFLEHLLDHITDVNVFVRSKVLKLWQEMYRQKTVPKHFIIPLLEHAIERFHDKSSYVSKNAMQLVSVILENNLYGPLLQEDAVKQNLKALKSRLIETESNLENPSAFKIWFCSRSEFADFISAELKNFNNADEYEDVSNFDDSECNDSSSEEKIEDVESEKAKLVEIISEIQESIISQNFEKLMKSLKEFEEKYLMKVKMLKNTSEKVKYYQWIVGNLCRGDDSILLIPKITNCENSSDIKLLLDEPIWNDDEILSEFGNDGGIISYCEDHLKFTEAMSSATSAISKLMLGKSTPEVLEAIEFFKVAQRFSVTGAEEGVRNMLLLTDSKEPSIKEAADRAFRELYLTSESTDQYETNIAVADKLVSLLKKVTHEQKNALTRLVKRWVVNNNLGTDFMMVLWEKYSRKTPSSTLDGSKAAAVLLSMYASGKPEIVRSHLQILIKLGLGPENRKNYAFMKYTLQMFQALRGVKSESGGLIKYPDESELIRSLLNIIDEQFLNLDNYLYTDIAIEAISVIFALSELPDIVGGNLIKKLGQKILLNSEKQPDGTISCTDEIIGRYILIAGHVAFCEWQYLENDVINELKQRNTEQKSNEMKKKSGMGTKKRSDCNITGKKSLAENNVTDNFEDDAMAVANERIAECVRMVCENEILQGDTIMAKVSPMIINICQNPEKFKGSRLISAASISLSKMMMISSEYCSEYIQLFITMLEKTEHPDVKINLILAFGDLTFRFPNTVEPWTVFFYKRLSDNSTNVRYTALRVIAHLITNEMVKVKSQMSDVALCLVDEDTNIKQLAFHLFHELSTKGNTLYNVMPDVISRLSHPDHRTSEKNFETILKILMKLIVKDRHLESLVEKLCHRIRGASDERQCIDLSYCLTLITYSDRLLQKLVDNIACYAEKLNFAKVHKNFTNIIISCKRQKVNKLAELVAELENKIDIILTKGIDNVDADFLKPPKTPAKTPKTPRISKSSVASTRKLRLKASKRLIMRDSDESSDDVEEN